MAETPVKPSAMETARLKCGTEAKLETAAPIIKRSRSNKGHVKRYSLKSGGGKWKSLAIMCLQFHESTDVSNSAQLLFLSGYVHQNEIKDEFIL
jgi:hypothetical protein